MKKIILLTTLILFVVTLSACGVKYTNISNDRLQEMLDSDIEYQFIDVRTSGEYYEEHIPGFTINIDYYLFEDNYSLLDNLDKNIPIVIMCNSGNRSVSAAEIMLDLGFTEVYNLEYGIQGWTGVTE
ncbi:MAG: rhodanese-like domain-containing protein [Candidatus Izemoplasma sp.]